MCVVLECYRWYVALSWGWFIGVQLCFSKLGRDLVIYVNGGHVMLVDGVLDEFIDDPVRFVVGLCGAYDLHGDSMSIGGCGV